MHRYRIGLAILAVLCLFVGCLPNSPDEPAVSKTVVVAPEGETVTGEHIELNLPKATGSVTFLGNNVAIDASNTADGYVMVKATSERRLKVRVLKDSSGYNYDLNPDNRYEVYPLQMGDGTYEIRVMEQVEGNSYALLYQTELEVALRTENRVFVFPNQYIWYTNETAAVEKSYALCAGITGEREKFEVLYRFVVETLSYDDALAAEVQGKSGYLPDLGTLLERKKGICFDYAALLAAMLRAQNIPVTLVIGNVMPENILHAWNQVYLDGKWIWCDATMDGTGHEQNDYTEERRY